jgi:hypothetical protein
MHPHNVVAIKMIAAAADQLIIVKNGLQVTTVRVSGATREV